MQAPSSVSFRAAVLILLVAAACTGGGVIPPSPSGPELSPGGAVRFALDRWPQCLNPLTSCAESSSSQHSVLQAVLPKLMWIDRGGGIEASPLLTQAPTLENGGLTPSPFTITYHLNPRAVWSDGSPITSADVRFTLKAILNTKGSVAPTGYDKIFSVATPDPTTVTLNFREPYADWYDLFGGAGTNGYVLKGSAFPDADPDKPDLSREMNTLIPFSGGPWRMLSCSESQLVLVRNEAYWGLTYVFSQISRALVVLPLFSEVAIAGWRSDRLGGPIGEWDGAPYGVFWNMDYWYATG